MAWHGLTEINENLNLENCWLNSWDVQPEKLIIERQIGIDTETGKSKMCRIDTKLAVLMASDIEDLQIGGAFNPETYKPVTNKNFIKLATDSGLAEFPLESCGSVMDRQRVFLSFEMPESFQAAGREFKAFFNIGNGHTPKSGSVLWCSTSNNASVCNNSFTMNMSEKTMGVQVKHTKYSELKLAAAKSMIESAIEAQRMFAKTLDSFAKVKLSKDDARALFAGFIQGENSALSTRAENTVERLLQLHTGGAGNHGEDLGDVFNAITDFYTHESAGGDDKMKQFVSSEFGSGNTQKQLFWDIFSNPKTRAEKLRGMIALGNSVLAETVKANSTITVS